MTWALLVVVMWLALAGVAALVIGRSICMADEQDAGETDAQPNTVLDHVPGAPTRVLPPTPPQLAGSDPRETPSPSRPLPSGPLAPGAALTSSRPPGATGPTLTRSG